MLTKPIKEGIKYSLGVPVIGLGLSMFAFGAFLNSSSFSLFQSFLSTMLAFALPGQFVMADVLLAGGNLLNIFFAVLLTNARLFPMTLNMLPIIKENNIPKWKYYLISHLIAVTAWINMFYIYKKIKKNERFEFFLGLSGSLWITSIFFTVLGYISSNLVNEKILIGMIFFNPMYFLVMTLTNILDKKLLTILLLSTILGPLLHYMDSNWGILFAGLFSGTIGFLIFRKKLKK